ncbi:MAG: serine hydrolase domain-containing protein, partial [Streptosporangiaceae bacterium]
MSSAIDGTAIDKVLRDAVDSGGVPHVAAIAANRDGVIYQGAAGPRAVGESDPVTVDTLFRIMSMTKMPCTVAALQQVEQGNLDLDAPVADYCPEFAEIQVLTGFDGDTPVLRPPTGQATVRNLVTHTSGLGYWFWSEDLVKWETVTGIPNVVAGSAASLTAPMVGDPGAAFIYGINLDWLGKVVEAVTGTGLDVAIKQGITGPLGMDQTTFLMNDDQRPNSTPVHVKGEDGTWTAIGEVLNQAPDYWAGGHGLYGPPSDYIKFQRAL